MEADRKQFKWMQNCALLEYVTTKVRKLQMGKFEEKGHRLALSLIIGECLMPSIEVAQKPCKRNAGRTAFCILYYELHVFSLGVWEMLAEVFKDSK